MNSSTSPPWTLIEPTRPPSVELKEVLRSRELVLRLARRDIRVRYAQTLFGASWAIVQPLSLMIVFALFLGRVIRVPQEGIPYSAFVLSGLVPWTFVSGGTTAMAQSLTKNVGLVSRVYFPRLVLPTAALGAPALDFAIAQVILVGFVAIVGLPLGVHVVGVVAGSVVSAYLVAALGVGLAALNVRYRDIGFVLPFALQLWMFASPVVYPLELLPPAAQSILQWNPMVAVVGVFRYSLLADAFPTMPLVKGLLVTSVLAFASISYFVRAESTFADVI